jgi:hypothetical protein
VVLREGIVGIKSVSLDEGVFGAYMFGKRNSDRRRFLAGFPSSL